MKLSLPGKVFVVGAIVIGAQAAYSYRARLLSNEVLENYAAHHPQHAQLAYDIVSCNSKLVVDIDACGAHLIERYGSDALMSTLSDMAAAGAFGDLNQN